MALQSAILEKLVDECEALQSIYGDEILVLLDPEREYIATIRENNMVVRLLMRLGLSYPISAPEVELHAHDFSSAEQVLKSSEPSQTIIVCAL